MKSNLLNVLKKELREMFRDKKSLLMMLMIPVLIPAIILGMSALFEAQVNKDVSEYNKIGFNYEFSDTEKAIAEELSIDYTYKSEEELKKSYEEGSLFLYVVKTDNRYVIYGDDSESASYAFALTDTYFTVYKEYLQSEYLTKNQIQVDDIMNIIVTEKNIKEGESFFVGYITTYAFLFIIMAITVSATYPATDATAGEKERGTLETLLTFPISSRDIIVGKFLSVSVSSVITGLVSLLLMLISLHFTGGLFDIYKGINLMPSVPSILFALVVIVAYSLLISGLCISIASKSKTFKEAQSALTPLTLISVFPGMIVFMAQIKSTYLLSLIPFINFTLLFDDITNGTVNYIHVLLMLVSTIAIITVILTVIIKQYTSEKVLFNS